MRAILTPMLLAQVLACAPTRAVDPVQPSQWITQAELGHPLVGRVVDTGRAQIVSPQQFVERARTARFVLLGEKHDNADHHRLQAWLLEELSSGGRRPIVGVEMIALERRDAVLEHRREGLGADAFAEAVEWSKSGWPDWELYRPVFAAALAQGLDVEPLDISRELARRVSREGMGVLSADRVARTGLDEPLAAHAREALRRGISDAHCGMLPDVALDAMVDAQRARDAWLADGLIERANADGAVLIAGAGHATRDAVPAFLMRRKAEANIASSADLVSLAFVEVGPGTRDLDALLAEDARAFDFLWLTPRVDNLDPCDKFKQQLERMHK